MGGKLVDKIRHIICSKVCMFIILILVIILFVAIISDDPVNSIMNLMIFPLAENHSRWHILERAIPLIFTGSAFCFILSVNQFNLAVEGIFYLGGFIGALVGIYISFLDFLHPFLALLAAALSGLLIMFVLAFLSEKFKLPIMVLSLMANYIILYIILHFLTNVVRDNTYPYTATFSIKASAKLPLIYDNTSISLVLSILFTIGGAILRNKY